MSPPQPYGTLLLSVGATLLAVGVLLLVWMLRVLIGPFQVAGSLAGERAPAIRVGIWEPASLAARSGLQPSERERLIALWDELVPEGMRPERLHALPAPGGARPDVVIAADLRWLDDGEREQIESFLGGGGSLVAAGWIGVRANEDWAAGERRMARLLGVKEVARNPRDAGYFVAAGERGPLVAGLAPGRRMALGPLPELPALAHSDAELFWATGTLRPAAEVRGAALRRELGPGRLVWLAPAPGSVQTDDGRAALRTVVGNALDWAARRPFGELLAWPDGARFAGLLAMDTEQGYDNALAAGETARRHGAPITFLALSSVALAHRESTARLARLGELGSHADVHEGFKDLPHAAQRERLARSRRELESLGVAAPRGFRPPYESYDGATPRALVEEGFGYLLGDLDPESMAPRLLSPDGPGRSLVQVPRPVADDHELLIARGLSDPSRMREIMERDLERIERSGGLYYFSFHTQHFGTRDRLGLVAWLADALRERGAWCARAGELASWWRRRAAARVRFERAGPRRLQVLVSLLGPEPLERAVLRVYLNTPVRELSVTAAKLFQRGLVPLFQPGAERVDLRLPELEPGKSYAWSFDYALASD